MTEYSACVGTEKRRGSGGSGAGPVTCARIRTDAGGEASILPIFANSLRRRSRCRCGENLTFSIGGGEDDGFSIVLDPAPSLLMKSSSPLQLRKG